MVEADKTKVIDQFTKFLTRIANDLKNREENIPISLKRLYVYCDKYVARNKGKVSHFKRYYKLCKDELLRMSKGGFLYFPNKYYTPLGIEAKEQFYDKMEQMSRQIILAYWPPQEGVIDDLDILEELMIGPFRRLEATLAKTESVDEMERAYSKIFPKSRMERVFEVAFTVQEVMKLLEKYSKPLYIDGREHDLVVQWIKLRQEDKNWEIHHKFNLRELGYHAPIEVSSSDKVVCHGNNDRRVVKCVTNVHAFPLVNSSTGERKNLVGLYIVNLTTSNPEDFLKRFENRGVDLTLNNEPSLRNFLKSPHFKDYFRSSGSTQIIVVVHLSAEEVEKIISEIPIVKGNATGYLEIAFVCLNNIVQVTMGIYNNTINLLSMYKD